MMSLLGYLKEIPLNKGKLLIGITSSVAIYGVIKLFGKKSDEDGDKKNASNSKKKKKEKGSSQEKKNKDKSIILGGGTVPTVQPKEPVRPNNPKSEEHKKKKDKKSVEELKNSIRVDNNKSNNKFKEKEDYQEDYSENDGEFSTGMATDDHYRQIISREEFKMKSKRNFSTDVEDLRFNKDEVNSRKKKILKMAKQEKGHDKLFFQMLANLADGEE